MWVFVQGLACSGWFEGKPKGKPPFCESFNFDTYRNMVEGAMGKTAKAGVLARSGVPVAVAAVLLVERLLQEGVSQS